MQPLRIAVAGCGPAGLTAALLLARDGHDVTLFERFEAPRPIGSGLMIQPTGLAVLRAMGLETGVLAAGARINRLFGKVVPSGRTVLDVRYAALARPDQFGIGIHRAALFAVLHDAVVAAGIPVRTGHAIRGVERGWLSFDAHDREGPFDLVVDSLGTGSPLAAPCGHGLAYGALWASLPWPEASFAPDALEQRYVKASRMVGVLPIGEAPGRAGRQAAFFWSLRVDAREAWRRAGLDAWKHQVRTLWPETTPLLDGIKTPEALTFARYTHRTVRAPVAEGVIQIGDAWHSASPQLGQGANMALLDAYALALAVRRAPTVPAALATAIGLRRRHVSLYQLMSALFTPAYQGDSALLPLLRDRVIGPLSRYWPASRITAAMVSGMVGQPLAPLGLEPQGVCH